MGYIIRRYVGKKSLAFIRVLSSGLLDDNTTCSSPSVQFIERNYGGHNLLELCGGTF